MSRQAIQAPPATPPLYSLLQAADVVTEGQINWHQGVAWAPEQTGGGGVVAVDPCIGNTDEMVAGDNPDVNTADPFVVYAEDHCSALGFQARDFEGRARRQLAATQSAHIAREFQLGAIRDAESLGNVALVDAVEVGPGGSDVSEGIGILEAAAGARYAGGRAMLHVTPQTFVEMGRLNMLNQAGQKWLTYPGNVVVMDAGYVAENGEAPPDAGMFAYATPMVQVYLSPIEVPASFQESFDHRTNSVEIFAQRMALVVVDHDDQASADLFFKVELALPPWHAGS